MHDLTLGPHQRLRHSVRGRRRLLPRLQRDRVRGQRGERAPLDAALGADHAQKHLGYEEPPRDPLRQRKHFVSHAGKQI